MEQASTMEQACPAASVALPDAAALIGMLAVAVLVVVLLWASTLASRVRGNAARFAPASGDAPRVCVLGIGTSVPPHILTNEHFCEMHEYIAKYGAMSQETADFIVKRLESCGIDQRHVVMAPMDLSVPPHEQPVPNVYSEAKSPLNPTSGARQKCWREHMPGLAIAAARKAMKEAGVAPSAITHVLFNSTSGWKLPGVDVDLVDGLGLKPKLHFGFNHNGCHSGDLALSLAKAYCLADPEACVLVVCGEISSLHYSSASNVREEVIGNTIFADGAGAAIVRRSNNPAAWALTDEWMEMCPKDSRSSIIFIPGDGCQEFTLSRDVPFHIGKFMRGNWKRCLKRACGTAVPAEVDWAIHPGGRAILMAVEHEEVGIPLAPGALDISYDVLSKHGNMSGATIFFVLERVMAEAKTDKIFGICFGPGMTSACFGLERGA